jgi:DNA-binding transcriptional ArsR family regulator
MDQGNPDPIDRGNRLDARSLRGLAHPLRLRLMELLWLDGPATATGLAARVGESTGTTSWHLRQLAEHGLIEDDPARGSKRERWWRVRPTNVEVVDFIDDPSMRGPLSVYLHESLNQLYHRLAGFLAQDWDRAWYEAAAAQDWSLRLQPTELRALNDELRAVVARYRGSHHPDGEPRAGEEHVIVQIQAFPHHRPAT